MNRIHSAYQHVGDARRGRRDEMMMVEMVVMKDEEGRMVKMTNGRDVSDKMCGRLVKMNTEMKVNGK